MKEPQRSVERIYAHFHRVLANLLEQLLGESQVTWLDKPGHTLTGDYNLNIYNPAIYTVNNLSAYLGPLEELAAVQAEALEVTGRRKPGRNLLPPLTATGVTHVRISRHEGQTGRTVSREAAVRRLEQLEEIVVANLTEFERYASRQDPDRKRVEAELKALRKASATLEQSKAAALRETYRQTVIRPYVYFLDGRSSQLHMRSTGLIAAGPAVEVSWREGPRRVRSDKIDIPPLVTAGALSFYDLDAWEAARAR